MPDAVDLCLELLEPENRSKLLYLRRVFHWIKYELKGNEAEEFSWAVNNALVKFTLVDNRIEPSTTDLGREVLRLYDLARAVRNRLSNA